VTERVQAFAPGRVNLLGEHTDYNDGLALPFAIDDGVRVVGARADGPDIHIHARDLDAHDTFRAADPPRAGGWRAFARGIAAELGAAGVALPGAELQIGGSVPRGSGLSSSAALEVALALALRALADAPPAEPVELARLCSRVENEWVGAQTGLLDQLASLCGRPGSAVLIDFRSLSIEPVELSLSGHRLAVLDSGQTHRLSGRGDPAGTGGGGGDGAGAGGQEPAADPEAGYNDRRAECTEACRRLGLDSLRDATRADAERLPAPLGDRVRHVVGENARVLEAVEALRDGDLIRVGKLLDRSHASLRDLYAVSTPAVEAAVEVMRRAGALGARLIGGGFGGHVLGLFAPDAVLPDQARVVQPGPGAHLE
jgi:galactokinase